LAQGWNFYMVSEMFNFFTVVGNNPNKFINTWECLRPWLVFKSVGESL
jgi:hypothetical protein